MSACRKSKSEGRLIRVAWVDDRKPSAAARDWLARAPRCKWSGCFRASHRDLVRLAGLAPDLVLVGCGVTADLSLHWVRRIKLMVPAAQVILLGDAAWAGQDKPARRRVMRTTLRLGAGLKQSLLAAARWPGADHTKRPLALEQGITAREHEVLVLLAQGARYKDVADALDVTYNTVRTHVRRLFRKLQVRSAAHATLKYMSSAASIHA